MVRKITLLFLLCIGLQHVVQAQIVDSITISIPYGADTTCPGIQIDFTATHSSATDTVIGYRWFTDNTFTGVVIDTFHTTALTDGDSVYCWLYYENGMGVIDSAVSNTIIIHRSDSIPPRVAISLIVGSNPDCAGHPLTFLALPVNGGTAPAFQWYIDSVALTGEDSITITHTFSGGDTVKCLMISNSTCLDGISDTAFSPGVVIIHDSLSASISILAAENPICEGKADTFTATTANTGSGATLSWYVDSTLIPSALGPVYYIDSLHNGDLVYCILNAPDPCVINHTTTSNIITMTVIGLANTSVWTILSEGNNPGCLDSSVTFTGHSSNFGSSPDFYWYVNGVLELSGDSVFTHFYLTDDVVTYRVAATADGCYTNDTLSSAPIVMVRDSTPPTPLVSLIGDLLVINNGGSYIWYLDSTIIPGAVNQTFHPTELGYYYVVKDSANCPSLPSNVIYISLTGVKNVGVATVKIYPNPTTGIVNMDWGSVTGSMKVDVLSITGQEMRHEEVSNQSRHETDISGLPTGSYFITLTDQNGNKGTFKIALLK